MAQSNDNKKRIATMADLHVTETSQGIYREVFDEVSNNADILVLCGDLTDLGKQIEAEILRDELRSCRIPVACVMGNHDFQSDENEKIREILVTSGIHVLDREPYVIEEIGFAGVKGFGGGYDRYSLGSFGESTIKSWVQETINEVFSLENQLQKLTTEKKVVLMHYSPVRETLNGEPEEIFPFLGSSRFLEPIENFDVSMVFHGHAHNGSHLGKTPAKAIPVYNVSIPVLKKEIEKQYVVYQV